MTYQALLDLGTLWVPFMGGGEPFSSTPAPDTFELLNPKRIPSLYGIGIIRTAPTGAGGTLTGTQTIGTGAFISGKTINGNVTISGTGQLLDCIVNGVISCSGSGWLVENNDIRGNVSSNGFVINTGGSNGAGGTIQFNKIRPTTPNAYTAGIGPRYYYAYRNDVSGVVDCFGSFPTAAGGVANAKAHGNWGHDMSRFAPDYANSNRAETHNDVWQIQGGSGHEAIGNWFSAYHDTTIGDVTTVLPHIQIAAFMINNNVGSSTGILVDHNLIDGGQFAYNCGPTTGVSEQTVTWNTFDYGAQLYAGGPTTYAISIKNTQTFTVTNNFYDDGVPVVRRVG